MSHDSFHKAIAARVATQLSAPPETTACQKLMIILATCTFIALAGLTAGLPMNYPSNQGSMYASSVQPNTIVDGDIAWMIVATILGFLLVPAFAYLYSKWNHFVASFKLIQ